jgi:RNA 3'-terminal phosphate cyclase
MDRKWHSGAGNSVTVVSMEDVVLALQNTLGKKGMSPDDIGKLAEYLMSFFGFTDEVIDNRLTSEDRDVFYMLEEEGFLTTTQEEVHLKKGKLWRIHYWILKKDQILRLARREEKKLKSRDECSAVYDEISEDVWTNHRECDDSEPD